MSPHVHSLQTLSSLLCRLRTNQPLHKAAKSIGAPVVAALDACFCGEAVWTAADKAITDTGERLVEIVTRAQTNTAAHTTPKSPKARKRGQPRKYGDKVILYGLFADIFRFTKTTC